MVTHTIGGTISGLSGTLVLQDNGGDNLSVTADGGFTFAIPLPSRATYNVTTATQPTGQTCAVSSGSGVVGSSDVTGVTVSGLSGTVMLQDNGGDDLSLTADGGFTFATPLASGVTYSVTVATQSTGQTCAVTNGSGTVGSAAVTSVSVNCSDNSQTTPLSNSSSSGGGGGTLGPLLLFGLFFVTMMRRPRVDDRRNYQP